MSEKSGMIRVGTSGYQYDHWSERFYPADLPKKEWLGFYAAVFDTVEINNTFYGLPEPATFEHWRGQAPEDFLFSLKFSRYGSHRKCLKDPKQTIGAFLESACALGPALGPILVQLKPHWSSDPERLEAFLSEAPQGVRWAVEFRDPSWLRPDVFTVLREHNAALVIHDMIDNHPEKATADWMYLRFHGDHYTGHYSPQFLTALAKKLTVWRNEGRDVYVYFNNDAEGCAVEDARKLKRYLENR